MNIAPVEFGLPNRYQEWRPGQWEAVNWVLDSPARFVALCAPTGYGKSLAYMAMAALSGRRTMVLTSTKGLQDQLNGDFASISTDIRGMQNYPCEAAVEFGFPVNTKVADAPCLAGAKCGLRSGGCGYFDQLRRAQRAKIVVTNYQCWLHSSTLHTDENPVEMLVCDEAHDSIDELCSYLGTELERKECLVLGVTWPISGYDQGEWAEWAQHWEAVLAQNREDLEQQFKTGNIGPGQSILHEIRESKRLEKKLNRVGRMSGEWVIEELNPDRHDNMATKVKFDPLWPDRYREVLFQNIPKIVLVSATVRPKTAALLGIDEDELDFTEYDSSFPIDHRPVIHIPTVRMNYNNEKDDDKMMWLLRKIDLLIGARLDRKGVIHTVSYKRARFIKDNSQYQDRMMIHGSDDRARVIERFKQAGPGTVLLSPSVDTGYDFAGELAEYQIIVKLPFPDTRGAIMKARCHEDKEYSAYLTAQILQQMTGRVCRSETDRGETLIVDDNVTWFIFKHRDYINGWWKESYRQHRVGMPKPLEKL